MPRRNYRQRPKLKRQVYQTGCDKQKFTSKDAAERAAELKMLADQSLELGVYRCPFCGSWHLTHKKR